MNSLYEPENPMNERERENHLESESHDRWIEEEGEKDVTSNDNRQRHD